MSSVKCIKNNGDEAIWTRDVTSAFMLDVQEFARDNKIQNDFGVCNSKVFISVAHYFNGPKIHSPRTCRIARSYDTPYGKAVWGNIKELKLGTNYSPKRLSGKGNFHEISDDYSIMLVDSFQNEHITGLKGLQLCNYREANKFREPNELPHLAKNKLDNLALTKNAKNAAKLTSGTCTISGMIDDSQILEHNCDSDKRSSGAPLLQFANSEMCVVGIQATQVTNNETGRKFNGAISVKNPRFIHDVTEFLQRNCLSGK